MKGGELPHVDEDQVRAEIQEEAKELSDRGIETKVEVAEITVGGPAHAIVEIADRNDGDLIVTGMRGHGSVAGLMLGSVAHGFSTSRSDRRSRSLHERQWSRSTRRRHALSHVLIGPEHRPERKTNSGDAEWTVYKIEQAD